MVVGGAAQVAINNLDNMNNANGGEGAWIGFLIGGIIGLIISFYFWYDNYIFNKWLKDPVHNRRDWWNISGDKK